MDNTEHFYKQIAIILGILLAVSIVVILIMWSRIPEDTDDVLDDLQEEVVDYQEAVRDACGVGSTTQSQSAKCQDTLDELERVVSEYRDRLNEAVPGTTTATST